MNIRTFSGIPYIREDSFRHKRTAEKARAKLKAEGYYTRITRRYYETAHGPWQTRKGHYVYELWAISKKWARRQRGG